jgi:hypothetical protein
MSRKKEAPKLKPMSPWQVQRELAALDKLYDEGDCQIYTDEWYEQQKSRIMKCSRLWGAQ